MKKFEKYETQYQNKIIVHSQKRCEGTFQPILSFKNTSTDKHLSHVKLV